MIKGFDKVTLPLNEYERDILLPIMVNSLITKIGSKKAVTNVTIVSKLRSIGHKISEPRVRKIINHIRTHDLIKGIIATSDGYYIAQSRQEYDDYIESLQGRISAIEQVKEAIIRQKSYL